MSTVLGIDAAWTERQPSGVALAVREASAWRLVAVVSSYRGFHTLAARDSPAEEQCPSGSRPDAATLLASAREICGRPIDLVAIDMPLAYAPITGRRRSDNDVSTAYGAHKCGTHSPSAERPGKISDDLRIGFDRAGYPLQTSSLTTPGLIEVYPHPALVQLADASERLPYKVSKIRSYWPKESTTARRTCLVREWDRIVGLLDEQIAGVASMLPLPSSDARGCDLKAYEDMLDAVVCAWAAICALEGRATPFGDAHSAIWIPT